MHPTPVYIDTTTNAKIIRMMDTYDSLVVIDERDGFCCVMINGGIGYVEKEEKGAVSPDKAAAYDEPYLKIGQNLPNFNLA